MAAVANVSKSRWARLFSLSRYPARILTISPAPNHQIFCHNKPCLLTNFHFQFLSRSFSANPIMGDRVVQELLAEVEREKQLEREERKRKGLEPLDDEDEDYMGVGPLIERMERRKAKELEVPDHLWEPTDSDSDEDDERYSPEELKKNADIYEKKKKRHAELLKNFAEAETLDDAHKWMTKINSFEEKYMKLPLEYRVIGDMMNRLKESTGKERFILLQKLNRAVKLMEIKEAYDPNNPENFGIIQHQQVGSPDDLVDSTGFEKERQMIQGNNMDEDENDFNESKEDDTYAEKLSIIEKKLEEKLVQLDNTFGKKRRVLEEEIKELVDERNALTERKKRPLYRKGFDVKVIDINRTCKVTKGGQIVKYTALLATGNFHGVIGFAKAKGTTAKIAIQKAYEKCFQNLHYVERYEEHTIAHAVQSKYEKTKLYLWPGPRRSGVRAAVKSVETVLYLAGFSNVKSKIIGSRNPLNVIKALFIALNAIETPKDIQEKFGRTVVETYLL